MCIRIYGQVANPNQSTSSKWPFFASSSPLAPPLEPIDCPCPLPSFKLRPAVQSSRFFLTSRAHVLQPVDASISVSARKKTNIDNGGTRGRASVREIRVVLVHRARRKAAADEGRRKTYTYVRTKGTNGRQLIQRPSARPSDTLPLLTQSPPALRCQLRTSCNALEQTYTTCTEVRTPSFSDTTSVRYVHGHASRAIVASENLGRRIPMRRRRRRRLQAASSSS